MIRLRAGPLCSERATALSSRQYRASRQTAREINVIDLARRLVRHFLAPPANVDVRAMRSEAARHFLARSDALPAIRIRLA
jgi:hypothetical protein